MDAETSILDHPAESETTILDHPTELTILDLPPELICKIVGYLGGVDYENCLDAHPAFRTMSKMDTFRRLLGSTVDADFVCNLQWRAIVIVNECNYFVVETEYFEMMPVERLSRNCGYFEQELRFGAWKLLYDSFFHPKAVCRPTELRIWFDQCELAERSLEVPVYALHPLGPSDFTKLVKLCIALEVPKWFPPVKKMLAYLFNLDHYVHGGTFMENYYKHDWHYWYQWLHLDPDQVLELLSDTPYVVRHDIDLYMASYGFWHGEVMEKLYLDYPSFHQSGDNPLVNLEFVDWIDADRVQTILETAFAQVSPYLPYNGFVAGGFVLWAILASLGRAGPAEGVWNGSDIDYYHGGRIPEPRRPSGWEVRRNFDPEFFLMRRPIYIREHLPVECIPEGQEPMESDQRIVLPCQERGEEIDGVYYPHRHLQSIPWFNYDPGNQGIRNVLLTYDMSICQASWDGENILVSLALLHSLQTNRAFYRRGTNPARVAKYASRGFEMVEVPIDKEKTGYEPNEDNLWELCRVPA